MPDTTTDTTTTMKPLADPPALREYKAGTQPLPPIYRRWHLYGAGLENVGDAEGRPEALPLPDPGPDEILVRHDACGICFSDIKIIALGPDHPRLQGRDLRREPVVMGHEVALTVVRVGENLTDRFRVGQRFIVQADVFYRGANLAYGYALPGGMSQFGIVGPEVLEGDEGCYLLPIRDTTGYAEAALVEPWACVEAAYHWAHRAGPKAGGNALLVGEPTPSVEQALEGSVVNLWDGAGDAAPEPADDGHGYDDIVFVGVPTPAIFEAACARLGKDGIVCLLLPGGGGAGASLVAAVDVGRVHYDGHRYVGAPHDDITAAYAANTRAEVKPGGTAWFVGAAGPMGQMHVQRALQRDVPPARIVGTDRDPARLESLRARFAGLAREKNVELVLFNPEDADAPDLGALAPEGFDDIVIMVPAPPLIEQAMPRLAPGGVLNIFAGVARGTTARLDVAAVATRNVRVVGTTGSTIADLAHTRDVLEQGALDTGASLAAIGGLNAFRDGLEAVKTGRFPGKTVIFPQIEDLPLTALDELEEARPAVHARLREGRFWTAEAEEELLREALLQGPPAPAAGDAR
jgi:threonine dehydrogenase-like Zn-dependent dehydrogenase